MEGIESEEKNYYKSQVTYHRDDKRVAGVKKGLGAAGEIRV